MKICILASGRCGSTSLFHCINKHLPKFYYSVSEPFHRLREISFLDEFFLNMCKEENVFIKTLVGQEFERPGVNIDWIYNTFNKIIILDRRDQKSQAESMGYHLYLNDDLVWHKKKYYEINKISPELLKHANNSLEHSKKNLEIFGIEHKIKTYYYEDIFIDKNVDIINEIFNYIELVPNKETINTYIISEEFKVRLDQKYNSII